jgi:hypothetical protein
MFRFSASLPRRALLLLSAGLLAGTVGCFKDNGPCPVITINVTPNPMVIVRNTSRQFTAVARDAQGNIVANPSEWSVVAGGGTINSTGLFTAGAALGPFPNTVQATNGGLVGKASVTVIASPGPLASLSVTPDPATLTTGATQLFTATGLDADGNAVTVTPVWSVVAGGGAINTLGVFTAGGTPGTYTNTVKATSGAITDLATVVVTAAGPGGGAAVLGSASTYAVLGGSTVTNTGATTTIVGDVGVSPGSAITGLPAGQPTGGGIHISDASAVSAQANLTTAYNDLAGRACGTNLTSQDLGGMTLAPGVYCFNSTAGLTGTVTFDAQGNTNAVFVIQVASAVTAASNSAVTLIGGAQANNVFWQIGSSATIGTNAAFKGTIVALQSVTLNTGASLVGRALARNGAVTLASNTITLP